ncbi:MAG: WYL domain-containing protein [Candidatus Gastranaerophilales bacterium]|nr:WYL domain-containing protein [Candidatus Gastranaerophilales bacterium]
MNTQELNLGQSFKTWISITGYRILIILKSLMLSGRTIDELAEILKNDSITSKSVSKDTIRIAINTLKSAGCKILRPSKANGFKYELLSHPFCLKITDEELNSFIKLRDRVAEDLRWSDIFIINDLYEKIINLTCDLKLIEDIKNTSPLKIKNKQIIFEIANNALTGKKLNIRYLSPRFGEEDIEIIPDKITFENGRIYLWCFNLKYNRNGLLNAERILKINSVSINNTKVSKSFVYDVIYEINGIAAEEFELKENEKIIEENENTIKVCAVVDNEFLFIQRLLLFGNEFKLISPDFFREKLINKIKLIQKGYEK